MPHEVIQADRDAAEKWDFLLNHRYSEYEGDPIADLAADFAAHRLAVLSGVEELVGAVQSLGRCLLPIQMEMAQAEMVGDPIPDNAPFISFMGSGASDFVTAGELRRAMEKAAAAIAKHRAGQS